MIPLNYNKIKFWLLIVEILLIICGADRFLMGPHCFRDPIETRTILPLWDSGSGSSGVIVSKQDSARTCRINCSMVLAVYKVAVKSHEP